MKGLALLLSVRNHFILAGIMAKRHRKVNYYKNSAHCTKDRKIMLLLSLFYVCLCNNKCSEKISQNPWSPKGHLKKLFQEVQALWNYLSNPFSHASGHPFLNPRSQLSTTSTIPGTPGISGYLWNLLMIPLNYKGPKFTILKCTWNSIMDPQTLEPPQGLKEPLEIL